MRAKRSIEERSRGLHGSIVVSTKEALHRRIVERLPELSRRTSENLEWLSENMHPYFFITMQDEIEAIVHLAARLDHVAMEKWIILAEQEKKMILARLDVPGSIYDTLRILRERDISYAEMSHSYNVLPSIGEYLEIQRFEFDRKEHEEIAEAGPVQIPESLRNNVHRAMKRLYPDFNFVKFDATLRLLWLNHDSYLKGI